MGGETLTLTEMEAASSVFNGTLPISMTDGDGTLLIAAGDMITATYIDEDDGFGGINVEVTVNAVVDCAPPTISGVQVSDVGLFEATITFSTDEPATASVRYGTSCDALDSTIVAASQL